MDYPLSPHRQKYQGKKHRGEHAGHHECGARVVRHEHGPFVVWAIELIVPTVH